MPLPPLKHAPPKKQFGKDQVAEDTERSMQGRPQRFGAAQSDDDNSGAPHVELAQPGQDKVPPEEMGGGDTDQPGLEEGMPQDPETYNSREEAEGAMDGVQPTPENHQQVMKKHHGNLHDLHQRLRKLEGKSGGEGQQPPSGSGPQPPPMGHDNDGY